MVGVDTDCCVMMLATALFEYNIRPIVLTQYCASNGGTESHNAGITRMKMSLAKRPVLFMNFVICVYQRNVK